MPHVLSVEVQQPCQHLARDFGDVLFRNATLRGEEGKERMLGIANNRPTKLTPFLC